MADIHPQLLKDCLVLGSFPLCRLLLMKDANYPWFILVPDRENISEIHHLSEEDQIQLIRESTFLSAVIEEAFRADKINVAALGNVVPQLHLHHIVRYKDDIAWPSPIWGNQPTREYSDELLDTISNKLVTAITSASSKKSIKFKQL
ncbi:MAG: diadenosine tetraphosphate (Ap4A) HIT family hydrolase [Gammaproteobacteria bacterium]|jgi:diadenosine tetraphosphate (Ap4A) HIT family hydrolase